MVCEGIGLIDSLVVNNLASKISIFVLSMEDWIHLFVIIIFHLIVYELLSEFFGDVLNSLLFYTWCVLVLWVILTTFESSLEDWDIQLENNDRVHSPLWPREEMERIHMPAVFRKWLSWWGETLQTYSVVRAALQWFFFLIEFCARPCPEQIPLLFFEDAE